AATAQRSCRTGVGDGTRYPMVASNRLLSLSDAPLLAASASPLSTIGRKRMAKTLASSPPHNNLGHKARLHGSHCHQPHDKHQPSIDPNGSNGLLDRVAPRRNRRNP